MTEDADIVHRLNFIAGARESDLNDDGHIIAEGVAEILRLRSELAEAQRIAREWRDVVAINIRKTATR